MTAPAATERQPVLTRRADLAAPFTRRDATRLFVAAAVLVVALTAIFAADVFSTGLGLEVGQIASENIRAPRTIEFESRILTEQQREQARVSVAPQYDYTPDKANAVAAQQAKALVETLAPVDDAFSADLSGAARIDRLRTLLPDLSDETRATLLALTPTRWQKLRDEAARILDQVERTELRDSDLASQRERLVGRFLGGLNVSERQLAAEIVAPLLVPNSSFSESLTEQARDQAGQVVAPVREAIQQGEIIVDAGHKITALDMEKIDAFGLNQSHLDVARLGGWFILATLLVGLLLAWVWRFRPELWHRNNVLLLVGLILAFTAFALKVTAGRSILPFFLPTAAAGMLIAILLDAGAAIVLMAVLAVIAGALNGSSLEVAAYVFLGGFAGIVAVRRGDRFHVFAQAAIAIAVVNALVVSTFALLGQRELDARGVIELLAASAASGGGAGVAAVGSFAVLGNLFGILTVFQLLELANPSQPLLRRLLIETPGTYHHSIMVGNLAERAAEAIGADPLLARVAAYYHDIGKLANPIAFIENQAGGENIHDQLEPEVSAQVLKQHVADGIDIAYKGRLPKSLIAFIPQHHGTALMSFFLNKAREQASEPHGGASTPDGAKASGSVDQRKFRHAGPKPQSREAAVLMLADSVEASVRSLSSRDEAAIRAMVSRIIDERLKDGQFDECDLTLRDVERIREAFVAQLLGMYHQRIAYPQNKVVELESRRTGTGAGG